MRTIKIILAKYSAFLWGLLKPLGSWGVFCIAGIDSAFFGLPLDPVVASYVYNDRAHFWLYALMAAAGSALGSLVLYAIGYMGGEMLLEKRIGKRRFQRLHNKFERHEFLALMLPAILPPPTPFKLFVLAAAVFEMSLHHFLTAIFLGRLIRFLLLSLLTIKFGPQAVALTANLAKEHLVWVLAALGGVVIVWLVVRRLRRTPLKELMEEE